MVNDVPISLYVEPPVLFQRQAVRWWQLEDLPIDLARIGNLAIAQIIVDSIAINFRFPTRKRTD